MSPTKRRARRRTKATTLNKDEQRSIGRAAARGLMEGTLTLGQLVGLTDAELAAIGRAGETYRRAGRTREAIAVCGLLAAHAPLRAASWRALAGLLRQAGQPTAAEACETVVSVLSGQKTSASLRAADLAASRMGGIQ